ncbi:EndoU domain-containing protein [Saccharopolyspora sp. NPDC000359]|uniref:EndoU domain-containing protein n=1 Tax=Saccharopolyspora sp. NPDC000359 TaxID=3154251 RepID=UPI003332F3A2
MYGTGRAGKTEFPKGWDEKYISGHVLDVVKHPDSPPIKQSNGAWRVSGVRDGVLIEVAVRDDGYVVTAYPASGPGVNENPRGL